jgi:hypothetical protein
MSSSDPAWIIELTKESINSENLRYFVIPYGYPESDRCRSRCPSCTKGNKVFTSSAKLLQHMRKGCEWTIGLRMCLKCGGSERPPIENFINGRYESTHCTEAVCYVPDCQKVMMLCQLTQHRGTTRCNDSGNVQMFRYYREATRCHLLLYTPLPEVIVDLVSGYLLAPPTESRFAFVEKD